jgi:CP family cyanate transporter-like MFS transporter
VKGRGWFLIVALFLAALNLRPAIASISPVIGQIQDDLGLSRAAAGLLVTFPVLGMALFAPLASGLGARVGRERMVLGALALIGASTGARFLGGVAPMFATAILVGVGIATAQTLLPEVVKESFPARAALVTGIYTAGVNLGATVAASATVPLENSFGGFWKGALAFWGFLAVVAAAIWVSPARRAGSDGGAEGSGFPVRIPRTWLVVGIFSVTALMYFSAITWLAPLYRDVGFSEAHAGLLLSVFTGIQVFSSVLIPASASHGLRSWKRLAIAGMRTEEKT